MQGDDLLKPALELCALDALLGRFSSFFVVDSISRDAPEGEKLVGARAVETFGLEARTVRGRWARGLTTSRSDSWRGGYRGYYITRRRDNRGC